MLSSPKNGRTVLIPPPSSSSSASSSSPTSSRPHLPPNHQHPHLRLLHHPTSPSSALTSTAVVSHLEDSDSHHRQKLDLIRSSLRQFEEKWEKEEEERMRGEHKEEGEEKEEMERQMSEDEEELLEEEEHWDLKGWRADMVQRVVEAGYDRESAYYALKLVNFGSLENAIKVLESVKQNLVSQHQHTSNKPAELRPLVPASVSIPSPDSRDSFPITDQSLPPADPFPPKTPQGKSAKMALSYQQKKQHFLPSPTSSEWHHSPPLGHTQKRKGVPPTTLSGTLRQTKSFGPADMLGMSRVDLEQPKEGPIRRGTATRHVPPAGTAAIRIERNQSERNERKTLLDKQQEKHPLKGLLGEEEGGRTGKQQQQPLFVQHQPHCVTAFPICVPSSSTHFQHNVPRPVQRIFVDAPSPPASRIVQRSQQKQQSPPSYSKFVTQNIGRQLEATTVSAPRNNSTVTRSVSPLPESVAKKLKRNNYERAVKQCRAPMFRFYMEQHIEKLVQQYKERNQRAMQLIQEMELAALPDPVKERMLRLLRQKESKYVRLRRQKMNREMFELIRHIGIGAFGKVTLVRKKDTDQVYAMKTLVKADVIQKQQAAHVKAERDILSEANSPWIVKLFFSFQDVENLYFIMEYVPGGDMMQLLINMGIFPESLARFYIAELTLAVEYVHSLGFIHRDIKPDNILIDKGGHIKLTDFGLCTGLRWTHDKRHYVVYDEQSTTTAGGIAHLRDDSFSLPPGMDQQIKVLEMRHHRKRDRAHSVVGTGNYMAPEVVQKIGHTQLCDWWSVGVILYEMVYGRPPFLSQRDDPAETQFMIVHWRRFLDLKNPMGARLSKHCVDCVAKLCCDQEHRIGHRSGAKEIKAHPWFRGIEFANLRNTTPEYVPRVKHAEDTSNFDTFEVRSDELLQNPDSNNGSGKTKCGYGEEKPLAPNFIDFTFRHFFSEGMGPRGHGGRQAQSRPSLAPLIERSGGADAELQSQVPLPPCHTGRPNTEASPGAVPFTSAKRMPAPPAPGSSKPTVVHIGGPTMTSQSAKFKAFNAKRIEEVVDEEE